MGVKAYRLKAQEFILQITASYAHQQACKMECCVGTVEDELKMLLPNARGFPFWDNAALPLQLLIYIHIQKLNFPSNAPYRVDMKLFSLIRKRMGKHCFSRDVIFNESVLLLQLVGRVGLLLPTSVLIIVFLTHLPLIAIELPIQLAVSRQ